MRYSDYLECGHINVALNGKCYNPICVRLRMKVIVALKDTAARVFGVPFVVQAAAQAVRSLRDEVNSKESTSDVARHSDDFELYELAYFNEDSGNVAPLDPPQLLCRAKDLRDPS